MEKTVVTIQATVNAPVEKVWAAWNEPDHITKWNAAIDTWHCPWAKNDLRVGGSFSSRMEAKDGSFGFDFSGVYDVVETNKRIEYTMSDGRKVKNEFKSENGKTHITSSFDAENQNPVEMQRDGWQAILNNFKQYTEKL
ncbi:MAG TPA: SRPBCC family protein [Flavobacteriales bacterium]|nr:SRPBCC family protein [Flavobacteriales bacterium]